jgi:hypothetical protein
MSQCTSAFRFTLASAHENRAEKPGSLTPHRHHQLGEGLLLLAGSSDQLASLLENAATPDLAQELRYGCRPMDDRVVSTERRLEQHALPTPSPDPHLDDCRARARRGLVPPEPAFRPVNRTQMPVRD